MHRLSTRFAKRFKHCVGASSVPHRKSLEGGCVFQRIKARNMGTSFLPTAYSVELNHTLAEQALPFPPRALCTTKQASGQPRCGGSMSRCTPRFVSWHWLPCRPRQQGMSGSLVSIVKGFSWGQGEGEGRGRGGEWGGGRDGRTVRTPP